MLFKAKSRYSRDINTSGRCNRAYRFAYIKQRENSVFWARKEDCITIVVEIIICVPCIKLRHDV